MGTSIAFQVDWERSAAGADPCVTDGGALRVGDLAILADARIDNCDELTSALKMRERRSIPEILAGCYRAWGPAFPERLSGDFAFVIWDTKQRILLVGRDPFGIRTLYYRIRAKKIWLASEIEQVLETFDVPPGPNASRVVEYLTHRYVAKDATFFDGIQQVPPGHTLAISDSGISPRCYWRPPHPMVSASGLNITEIHEEFRRLFIQSVRRRLVSNAPVMIHVSGGLDSSSIACAADVVLRSGERGVPRVRGVAASYPMLSCDESEFIDTVARRVSFPIEYWDGTQSDASDLTDPSRLGPGGRVVATGGTTGDLTIARAHGGATILSGLGGDQLGVVDGMIRDSIADRDWGMALRELLFFDGATRSSRINRIRHVLKQYEPVTAMRWRRRVLLVPPVWLTAEMKLLASGLATEDVGDVEPHSHVHRYAWRRLTSAETVRSVEVLSAQGRSNAIEYRFPFLDQDLVRFTLTIPWRYWPSPGRYARVHRQPLTSLLPPEIAGRFGKAEFTPALANRVRRATSLIERLFFDGPWASSRYVDRERAHRLWRDVTSSGVDGAARSGDWRRLWAIVTLEAWLKGGYTPTA